MNIEQITKMLEVQYGIKDAELRLERDGIQYFEAIDAGFEDEIEVKVMHSPDLPSSVYTRMCPHPEVDIDVHVEGLTDDYYFEGRLATTTKQAIVFEFIG